MTTSETQAEQEFKLHVPGRSVLLLNMVDRGRNHVQSTLLQTALQLTISLCYKLHGFVYYLHLDQIKKTFSQQNSHEDNAHCKQSN